MSITQMEPDQLKSYLQENIESLLAKFEECTFDCPILFFDKQKDSLRYIKRESNFTVVHLIPQHIHPSIP